MVWFIGYGCGMIDTGSDVVDGLIVNAIIGSSDGNVNCWQEFALRLIERLSWLELLWRVRIQESGTYSTVEMFLTFLFKKYDHFTRCHR